jgi:hypothetical protein
MKDKPEEELSEEEHKERVQKSRAKRQARKDRAEAERQAHSHLEKNLKADESQPQATPAPNRKPWANTTKAKWGEILKSSEAEEHLAKNLLSNEESDA